MRHKRKKPDDAPSVDMDKIITPMLDMSFQLLAFFILTYHPSGLEGQMELNLPAGGEAKAKAPEDVDPTKPSDTDIELPSELTVMVKTVHDGVTDGVFSSAIVEGREGQSSPFTSMEELQRHLKRARQELTNKDDIKIKAESKLKYAYVVEVMDTCLRAGFQRVGFAPPPDLGSSD